MKGLKRALIDTLMKGAMKRIAPVSIDDRKPYRSSQEAWQSEIDGSSRSNLSEMGMDPNNRKRALHKLSGVTQTRRHPETGEREFLLHRGISSGEKKLMFDRTGGKPQSKYDIASSFTPHIHIANNFAKKYGRGGHENTISAWVPESQISNIPKQYGSYNATAMQLKYGPNFKGHGKNKYSTEHEVIVKPHPLNLVHRDEVSRLTGIERESASHGVFSLDQAINSRVHSNDRPDITRTYASVREPKKLAASEELMKAPIAYHGSPNDFDEFSTDHSGSNQGNASGHGIYFADKPEGAKFYAGLGRKKGTGGMYSADIPESKHFMDWDAPISSHPKHIASAMRNTPSYKAHVERHAKNPAGYLHPENLNGAQIYLNLENHGMSPKQSSEYMHSLGVKGIKRKMGKDTHFVVFNAKDAKMKTTPKKLAASELKGSKAVMLKSIQLSKAENQPPKVNLNPEHGKIIANAYGQMKHDPNHPEVKAAYGALVDETKKQFQDMLNSGFKISKMKDGQENPYKTSKDLHNDIKNNKHMWYFPTEQGFGSDGSSKSDHPLMQATHFNHAGKPMLANDLFRIVHDYRGHHLGGESTFGPKGEHQAYLTHKKDFSPLAQKALASETMGQNSHVNFGPNAEHNKKNPNQTIFAEQKAGLLPDHIINGKWHE